jgi:hypothetical protein
MPDPCEWQEAPIIEGMTAEQEKKLKSRKSITQSEEVKWKNVYRILFPDEEETSFPSPCKKRTLLG